MPSISEREYVMMLDMQVLTRRASSELAEARRPRNDLAHVLRSDFVATEPEEFARDVLYLADAQPEAHQPGADRHQAATHQSKEPGAALGSCNGGFRARNGVDQGLDFVGRTFTAKEPQNDADGFFGHSTIDAGLGSQPSNHQSK